MIIAVLIYSATIGLMVSLIGVIVVRCVAASIQNYFNSPLPRPTPEEQRRNWNGILTIAGFYAALGVLAYLCR